jgi:hypothetical protein
VSNFKKLASLALAAVTLVGTSAFAESRHSNETRSRGEARGTVRRSGTPSRGQVTVEGRRGDSSRNGSAERGRTPRTIAPRTETRSTRVEGRSTDRRNEGRTYERRADRNNDSRSRNGDSRSRVDSRNSARNNDRSRSDRYRNDGRSSNNNRYRNDGRYSNRQPYRTSGRVTRCEPYGRGYRVWVYGAAYPFFVPIAHWNPGRFRIGLNVSLGGYYNPLGYYDYWDGYRDGVYSSDGVYNSGPRAYSEADFRGEVESVDSRRDSFVVRNEETGNFITVVLRDRRENLPRAGDFVAVRGDWTTQGYFRAYDVDFLDSDRGDRY